MSSPRMLGRALALVSSKLPLRPGAANVPATLAVRRLLPAVRTEIASVVSAVSPRARLSLVAFVFFPTLVAAAYVGLIASRQYVTEMQFAVRGITQPLMGAGAGTFGGGQLAALMRLNNSQEANIVASYITSDNIVRDVDDDIDLRAKFSSTKIDFWDRLERNASFEQLVDYWKDKVYVGIDAVSGIMTVKVTAFSPADSLDIARAILKRSGKLVEVMLTQARQSALSRAEDEVRVAT